MPEFEYTDCIGLISTVLWRKGRLNLDVFMLRNVYGIQSAYTSTLFK
jgi:hypothetical protein